MSIAKPQNYQELACKRDLIFIIHGLSHIPPKQSVVNSLFSGLSCKETEERLTDIYIETTKGDSER